jgi:hypothetical protein
MRIFSWLRVRDSTMEKKTLLGNGNRFCLLELLHLYSLFEPTTIFLTSKMTYYILSFTVSIRTGTTKKERDY